MMCMGKTCLYEDGCLTSGDLRICHNVGWEKNDNNRVVVRCCLSDGVSSVMHSFRGEFSPVDVKYSKSIPFHTTAL